MTNGIPGAGGGHPGASWLKTAYVISVHNNCAPGSPQTDTFWSTEIDDAMKRLADLRDSGLMSDPDTRIEILSTLINPTWPSDAILDRVAREPGIQGHDLAPLMANLRSGADGGASTASVVHLHVVDSAVAQAEVARTIGSLQKTADSPLGRTWDGGLRAPTMVATVGKDLGPNRPTFTIDLIRRLYRMGYIEQGVDGEIAMLSGDDPASWGNWRSTHSLYSCPSCLDVFDDLSCPDVKYECSDCCGDVGH